VQGVEDRGGFARESRRDELGLRREAGRIAEELQEERRELTVEVGVDTDGPRDLERAPAPVADGVQPRVEVWKEAVDRVVVAAPRPERLLSVLDRRGGADRDRTEDRDSRGAV